MQGRPLAEDVNYLIVDQENVIVELGLSWEEFDEQPQRPAASLMGTPLQELIAGEETRQFVLKMLREARISNCVRSYRYRCDAPGKRRFCEMHVMPEQAGRVRIAYQLLKVERVEASIRFHARATGESVRCSMCNRVRHNEIWREPEIALAANLLRQENVNYVIYKVCGDCQTAARIWLP